jgi:hypothetical protein
MRTILVLGCLTLMPGAAAAQRLAGRVVDAASEAAVQNAEISVVGTNGIAVRALSDSTGRFLLRPAAGAGRYRVVVEHLAYAPATAEIEIGALDHVDVLIRLSIAPLALPPIEVVARSRAPDPFLERVGYYERRSGRQGVFIDPEQIERQNPLHTTDLFRNVSGVRVISLGGVRGNDIRITRGEDPNCPPRIYIDRVIVRPGGGIRSGDAPLDGLITPPNLHAIEIYRSPSEIPTELGGISVRCGVVMIWTKRGAAGR